ncbi:UNVERIFIED_CONTAM: Retrovirus-related Pol polyprotein from transposon RE2 [Sesamum indicum]
MTKKPFVGQSALANDLLNLIHADVCGPLNTPARGGLSYFITFTDDHTQYDYVYLMGYKFEAFGRFKDYKLEVENQTGCKFKARQSDQGREYLSGEFIYCLKKNGILSQWTPPGMLQLNGMAEGTNRTLLDMTTAKLLNMALSKTVPQTPYEIWHGKPVTYKYLGVWGSPAYVKRLVGDKLNSRVFLQIANATRCYLRRISETPQQNKGTSFEPIVSTDGAPILQCTETRYIDPDKWLEAMKSKMDSLASNKVWTLVDPPKSVKPVGCKWVYKHKLGAYRKITAFKARLVAKGYAQRPGVDFAKTYSPVAMVKSIRILLP